MFRTIQGVTAPRRVALAAVALIDSAAVMVAVLDDKVTNLLIAAGMVATSALIFGMMVDRRLGDAHDSGELRALRRQVAAHKQH